MSAVMTMAELMAAQYLTDKIIGAAQSDLGAFLDGADFVDEAAAAGLIRAYMSDLADRYNGIAAEVGNQLTENIRAAELGESGYTASMTESVKYQGAHDAYKALSPLFDEANAEMPVKAKVAQVREPLNAALAAEMRRAQKDNMLSNIGLDYDAMRGAGYFDKAGKIGYAVVPRGATCSWCTIMASRGFVYWSKETAARGAQKNAQFHSNCDCALVPGYKGDIALGDYNADEYYQYYIDARHAWEDYQAGKLELPDDKREELDKAMDKADGRDISQIQVFMRRMYGMS